MAIPFGNRHFYMGFYKTGAKRGINQISDKLFVNKYSIQREKVFK